MRKNITRFGSKGMRIKLMGLAIFSVVAATGNLEAGEFGKEWEAEWAKTIDAAKKEGQLTIYTARNQSEIINGG